MTLKFERHEHGTTGVYGEVGGIWIMLAHGEGLTKADMQLMRASVGVMARREPAGFPALTWVFHSSGYRIDDDARAAAREMNAELASHVRARATVIDGGGFQAAAVRALVTGIDLVSRRTTPSKVFAELSTAVEWCVAQRTPARASAGTPAAIVAALLEERAKIAH